MTKLYISKNTEAKTIATIFGMGVESLNPDDFSNLDRIIFNIVKTRNIDLKTIDIELAVISAETMKLKQND